MRCLDSSPRLLSAAGTPLNLFLGSDFDAVEYLLGAQYGRT